MSRSHGWSLTGVLALTCLGVGAIVVAELTGNLPFARGVTAAAVPAPALEMAEAPAPLAPMLFQAFDEISNRPLFHASRRPFEAPVEVDLEIATDAGPVEVPPPSGQLIGVMLSGDRIAALIEPEGGPASWYRIGDGYEGWTLEEVEPGRAILRAGETTTALSLRPD